MATEHPGGMSEERAIPPRAGPPLLIQKGLTFLRKVTDGRRAFLRRED